MDAPRVARSDRKAHEIRASAQPRGNAWKVVKLGRKWKYGRDRQGTEWMLFRGAFSGFSSGNREAERRVPEWEASAELEELAPFPRRLLCGTVGEHYSARISQRT